MRRYKNKIDNLFYFIPALMIINGVLSVAGIFRPSDLILLSLYSVFSIKYRDFKIDTRVYLLLSIAGFWFLTSTISMITNTQPRFELSRDIRLFTTLLWVPAYILYSVKRRVEIQDSITFGACIMAFSSISVYIMDSKLHRIAGFFSSAGGNGLDHQASYNEWGAIFSIAFCVSLNAIILKNKRSHIAFIIFIAIGLLLTQSRSGILATVVGAIIIIAYKLCLDLLNRNINRSSFLLVITLIFLPQLYVWLAPKLTLNRINESFQFGSNAFVSANDRFYMWKQAISIWSDKFSNIFFGIGQSAFEKSMNGATSDSFYLDQLAIFGIFSLMAYIFYALVCIYLSKNRIFSIAIFSVGATLSLTGNVIADPIVGAVFLLSLLIPGIREFKNEV